MSDCTTSFVLLKIANKCQCVVLRYSKVPEMKNKDISGTEKDYSQITGLYMNDNDDTLIDEEVIQVDTSEAKTAQEQLISVLQWFKSNRCKNSSVSYTFEKVYISDRNIYCKILNHNSTSATFLKLANGSTSSEAISIMKKFANQQLCSKYINKIETYKIVNKYNHKWNTQEGFITMTESEYLESLDFAIRRMGFKNNKSSVVDVIDWIVNDIILCSLSGVEYLHMEGIIHGDLSFGNFMFKKENDSNEKTKWIAVICDLNECFWMKEEEKIRSRRYCFGKDEYLMKEDCLASIESDCYAWMISICKMIYYIVFGKRDQSKSGEAHKQLTMIFDATNWSHFEVKCIATMNQILMQWKQIFEMVVTQKCKVTCNQLRPLFATKPLLTH